MWSSTRVLGRAKIECECMVCGHREVLSLRIPRFGPVPEPASGRHPARERFLADHAHPGRGAVMSWAKPMRNMADPRRPLIDYIVANPIDPLALASTCTAVAGVVGAKHFFGLCARCDARWLVTVSLDTAEHAARIGSICQEALQAYRRLWAAAPPTRLVDWPPAWSTPPSDPEAKEWARWLHWAATEREAAREARRG